MKKVQSAGRMGVNVALVAAEVAAFAAFLGARTLSASNVNETIMDYIQSRLSNYSPEVQSRVGFAMTDLIRSHLKGGMFDKPVFILKAPVIFGDVLTTALREARLEKHGAIFRRPKNS